MYTSKNMMRNSSSENNTNKIIIITLIPYHSVIECENKRGFKNYLIIILILNIKKVRVREIKQLLTKS